MQSSTHDCNILEMNDGIFNRKQVYYAEYPIITSHGIFLCVSGDGEEKE
jgi:hypothetical protein